MNKTLLDELLKKAIPPADQPHAPYDWVVISSYMTICLGSDRPTPLDREIGRGIDPATGRASRVLRYAWHELLAPEMSLDEEIAELLLEFTMESGGRSLRPGSGPGWIVDAFRFHLQDKLRRRKRREIPFSELGPNVSDDHEGELDPDDLPFGSIYGEAQAADPAHLADFRKIERDLHESAGAFLRGQPDLAATLRLLIVEDLDWKEIAARLSITREGLRLRRKKWGLVKPGDGGFADTHIGRWMSVFFTPDAEHVEFVRLALGVLGHSASLGNEP